MKKNSELKYLLTITTQILLVESEDSAEDIENAIIDRLGKSDIKWEYLGEMMDPRVNRITYEEVINGGDNATSGDPLHTRRRD